MGFFFFFRVCFLFWTVIPIKWLVIWFACFVYLISSVCFFSVFLPLFVLCCVLFVFPPSWNKTKPLLNSYCWSFGFVFKSWCSDLVDRWHSSGCYSRHLVMGGILSRETLTVRMDYLPWVTWVVLCIASLEPDTSEDTLFLLWCHLCLGWWNNRAAGALKLHTRAFMLGLPVASKFALECVCVFRLVAVHLCT